MPKILIATGIFPPSVGGPATYSKLLLDELPKRGIEVDVLSFDEVRHLPKGLSHLVFFFKLLKKSKGASIIYAQDTVSVGLPASLIPGKKFWLRVPGDYAWEQARQRFGVSDSIDDFQNKKYSFRVEFLRKIQRYVARRADLIITPSDYFKNLVSGWVSNPNKVKRIYNGIEIKEIKRNPSNNRTIFSSGRLVPWKGFKMLIEVTSELRKEYPDLELRIAGDGPEKLPQKEGVRLLGFLSKDEMTEELSKAHLFALNTGFESFSFAIVEAMAAGLPVVTTDIGNLREIVDDGKNGLLVPYNNKEELKRTIKKVLDNSEYADKLAENAEIKAKSFSIERTLDEITKIIKNEVN